MDESKGWRKGPLPPGTYFWGGVVPTTPNLGCGFMFADFCGDHVKVVPSGRILKADEVAWFNNDLCLPPSCPWAAEGETPQRFE